MLSRRADLLVARVVCSTGTEEHYSRPSDYGSADGGAA